MTKIKSQGTSLPDNLDLNVHSVVRPPTWRQEPYTLSYIMVGREVAPAELHNVLRWGVATNLPNPRVITPEMISWSSLFHPRFYQSVHKNCPTQVRPLEWIDKSLSLDFHQLSRLWLQSVLFLSGVTLSAAIIQHRFSSGTIGSKLDRLWDAGKLSQACVAPELVSLNLCDQVSTIAANHVANCEQDALVQLLKIREIFMDALAQITPAIGTVAIMRKSSTERYPDGRFNFVDSLHSQLGDSLRAIVVYGSSVSGSQFADIDAVLIVDDPVAALKQLAGASPLWLGKELNLGIYSPAEFLIMQRFSGDNLPEYGLCIWGQVEVINKPVAHLLARNFSFGVIRQRQQLGMLAREIATNGTTTDDRKNLYEYFVKIPANVTKGTFGAVGRRLPKEQVHDWLRSTIGFDTPLSQKQVSSGDVAGALAISSLATGRALTMLNTKLNVVRPVSD